MSRRNGVKDMNNLIMVLLTMLGLLGCKGYSDLKVDEFENMLSEDKTVQLVDVRTPEEYAAGHLPGAININWQDDGFIENARALLSTEHPVMVYCRSGKRSAAAAAKLDGSFFKTHNLLGGYLAWTEAGKPVSVYDVEGFKTASGEPFAITLIKHASLEIRYKGLSIQIDPVSGYGKPTDYATEFPKADIILITHEHEDHFDKEAIASLRKEDTRLFANARCADMLGWGKALANGERSTLPEGILLEAVPAYNTTEGHLQFHPKGRDNGYVLTLDGFRIYIAGDTEDIPEMAELKDIDIAFLPVNQPYTMTVDQCVKAAKTLAPKVLIPYHFSESDISSLPEPLSGIDVRLRQMQ